MRKSVYKLSVLLLLCFAIFTMQGTAFGAAGGNADWQNVLSMVFKVSNSKPTVGETINLSVVVSYSTGGQSNSLAQIHFSVDKPYVLKLASNGTAQVMGVGEAVITAEGYGRTQTIKIAASAKTPLEGAKIVKGVSYLPLIPVVKALGGTTVYDAPTKNYSIQVGKTKIAIGRGTAKIKVNGNPVLLKGAPFVDKGQTLVSSDLFVKALGASLQWDAANNRMLVFMGAGKLIINAEKPKPVNSSGMYEVAATGDMAGWKILKGHKYEKAVRIYFTYKDGILSTKTEDVRPVNLNQKVTWVDDSGRKRVNTVREIYVNFFSLSNSYTSDWLDAKFGALYEAWLFSSSVDASEIVDEYLVQSGQMQQPQSYITLTPDTVLE